mmetsp:Transcript_127188/g.345269  ORF Transcript_127188/g.345269 Transcript_127188/m.345269 type:complete len:239 (-) Transcript_127188:478-1194(-)
MRIIRLQEELGGATRSERSKIESSSAFSPQVERKPQLPAEAVEPLPEGLAAHWPEQRLRRCGAEDAVQHFDDVGRLDSGALDLGPKRGRLRELDGEERVRPLEKDVSRQCKLGPLCQQELARAHDASEPRSEQHRDPRPPPQEAEAGQGLQDHQRHGNVVVPGLEGNPLVPEVPRRPKQLPEFWRPRGHGVHGVSKPAVGGLLAPQILAKLNQNSVDDARVPHCLLQQARQTRVAGNL